MKSAISYDQLRNENDYQQWYNNRLDEKLILDDYGLIEYKWNYIRNDSSHYR